MTAPCAGCGHQLPADTGADCPRCGSPRPPDAPLGGAGAMTRADRYAAVVERFGRAAESEAPSLSPLPRWVLLETDVSRDNGGPWHDFGEDPAELVAASVHQEDRERWTPHALVDLDTGHWQLIRSRLAAAGRVIASTDSEDALGWGVQDPHELGRHRYAVVLADDDSNSWPEGANTLRGIAYAVLDACVVDDDKHLRSVVDLDTGMTLDHAVGVSVTVKLEDQQVTVHGAGPHEHLAVDEVHTVLVDDRKDALFAFVLPDDADRFLAAVETAGGQGSRSSAPLNDTSGTDGLIAAERED